MINPNEKENELTNSSGGGSTFSSLPPFPGVDEVPTYASDDFSLCVDCPPGLDLPPHPPLSLSAVK